jgi:glycerol-3-phosphate acyltransferase PlsY
LPHGDRLGFIAAFAAVCGHIFPVWLKFRGGKGVATGLGAFLLLTPKAVLVVIGIFLAMTAAFRIIALASIFAAASLPMAVWLCGESPLTGALDPNQFFLGVASAGVLLAGSALIIAKHQSNIRRMIAGTEPKFQLRRR